MPLELTVQHRRIQEELERQTTNCVTGRSREMKNRERTEYKEGWKKRRMR